MEGPDDYAEYLVSNARHDSVNLKRLTHTRGSIYTFLTEQPVISYLAEGEQPHYIFTSGGTDSPSISLIDTDGDWMGADVDYHLFIVLTNKRLLIVYGMENGDKVVSKQWNELQSAKFHPQARSKGVLRFSTNEKEYIVEANISESNVQFGSQYIREMGIPAENPDAYLNRLAVDANSDFITPERLLGVEEYFEDTFSFLQTGEQPHYLFPLTTGSAALIVESGAEREKLLKNGGTTVVTDRFIRIIGSKGDWTIPYNSVTSVDRVGNPSLHVQTSGRTYYINLARVHFDLSAEASKAANYIRTQQREVLEGGGSSNDPSENAGDDAMEKLEKLGELHDEGVLTDEEFEEKKDEILGDI